MENTDKLFLHKEYVEKTDLVSGEVKKGMRLILSAEQLQSGLIKEVGSRNFSILLAIASFLNSSHVAYPTIEMLSEITGLSNPTVIKGIKELETVTVGGENIFVKHKVPTVSGNMKSLYLFSQSLEIREKSKTPADYIEVFINKFEEVYGRSYVPNYSRDTKMVKDKLMAAFPEEDLVLIIETAVTDYKQWSSNPAYPTPTIGALCTWLANKAADKVSKIREEEAKFEQRVAEAASQVNSLDQLDAL